MPIQTSCPHCETQYNLPDAVAGKKVRCKKCQETFPVRAAATNGHAAPVTDTVPVICPHCETPAKMRALPGQRVRCKRCGEAFTVQSKVKAPARKTALASGDDDQEDTNGKLQAKVRPGKTVPREENVTADEDEDTNGKPQAKARNGKAGSPVDQDDDLHNRIKGKVPPGKAVSRKEDDEDETEEGADDKVNGRFNKNRKTIKADHDDDDEDAGGERAKTGKDRKTKKADHDDDEDEKPKTDLGQKTKKADGEAKTDKEAKKDEAAKEEGDKKKKKKKKKKKPLPMGMIGGGGLGLALIGLLVFFLMSGGEPEEKKGKKKKDDVNKNVSDNISLEGTAWRNLVGKVKDSRSNKEHSFPPGSVTMQFGGKKDDFKFEMSDLKGKVVGKYSLEPKDKVKLNFEKEVGIWSLEEKKKDYDTKIKLNKDGTLTMALSDGSQMGGNMGGGANMQSSEGPQLNFERWTPEVTPELPSDDPARKYYDILNGDLVRDPAIALAAVDWFYENYNPKHKYRGLLSRALEKPVGHPTFPSTDRCWETFTMWVTPKEIDRMRLQLPLAPKSLYRGMIMYALADFETEEAVELLATTMDSPEQELAQELLAGLTNTWYGAKYIKPYVYHHDPYVRLIAYSLLEIYGVDIAPIPRLPLLAGTLNYEQFPAELGTNFIKADIKKKWNEPSRLKQLAVLFWLQRQVLSGEYHEAIAKALDQLINFEEDQFMRSNAHIALVKWATKDNVSSLVQLFKSDKLITERPISVEILRNIADPVACIALIGIWPEMNLAMRESLRGYFTSLPDEKSKLAMLAYFNHEIADVQAVTREAVVKYQLPRQLLYDQCMREVNNEKRQMAAFGWLKSQEGPADPNKKVEYLKQLEQFTMVTDPKDFKAMRLKGEALAVARKWGVTTPAVLISLLESPECSGPEWKEDRNKAMTLLADLKYLDAVPAIAFRYKDVADKELALTSLRRIGKNNPPMEMKLCDAFRNSDKAKKLELLVVFELVGTFVSVDTFDAELNAIENDAERKANEKDLTAALFRAKKLLQNRKVMPGS